MPGDDGIIIGRSEPYGGRPASLEESVDAQIDDTCTHEDGPSKPLHAIDRTDADIRPEGGVTQSTPITKEGGPACYFCDAAVDLASDTNGDAGLGAMAIANPSAPDRISNSRRRRSKNMLSSGSLLSLSKTSSLGRAASLLVLLALTAPTSLTTMLASAQEDDGDDDARVCACNPSVYRFSLDFANVCPPPGVTINNSTAGVDRFFCRVENQDEGDDVVPVVVNSYAIFELDSSFNVIKQFFRGGLELLDGDDFEYTSITATGEIGPEDIPAAMQMAMTATNAEDQELLSQWIITFTNKCDVYPFQEGDYMSWAVFEDLVPPRPELCDVTPEPTEAPTAAPTPSTTATPEPTTVAPTTLAPIETPEPTPAPAVPETPEPTQAPAAPETPEPTKPDETPEPTPAPVETPAPTPGATTKKPTETDEPTYGPTPEPTEEPTPEPTKPDETPKPTPGELTLKPVGTPRPKPDPTSRPTPRPTPKIDPMPTPTRPTTPKPDPAPKPRPTLKPTRKPVAPAPKPTRKPSPDMSMSQNLDWVDWDMLEPRDAAAFGGESDDGGKEDPDDHRRARAARVRRDRELLWKSRRKRGGGSSSTRGGVRRVLNEGLQDLDVHMQ